MQKKMFLVPLLILALAIGTPIAFAADHTIDTNLVEEVLSVTSGTGAGVGAVAGFIMAMVAVIGKRIQGLKEPIIIAKLVITVVIAGAVGWLAPSVGITDVAVTVPAVIGIVYIVNKILKPVFSNWKTK